jgi:hypothetical protein
MSNFEPAAANALVTDATSPVTTSTGSRCACAARDASAAAGGYDSTNVAWWPSCATVSAMAPVPPYRSRMRPLVSGSASLTMRVSSV